jgi:hypothetical protein
MNNTTLKQSSNNQQNWRSPISKTQGVTSLLRQTTGNREENITNMPYNHTTTLNLNSIIIINQTTNEP